MAGQHIWLMLVAIAWLQGSLSANSGHYWDSLQYLAIANRNPVASSGDSIHGRASPTTTRRVLGSSPQCGTRSLSDFKIVGGKKAPKGAWPWLVALGYKDGPAEAQPSFQCGGALIAPKVVLTAAHCVHDRPDLYMVRLGENDLTSLLGVDLAVEESVVHAGYDPDSNENDIALLQLQQPVRISRLVVPICLPAPDDVPVPNESRVWIAGWGATAYRGPSSPDLMQLSISVFETSVCRKAYERFGKSAVVDDRVLCAGVFETGKDACQGDSGGPLMWEDTVGTFHVVGVISFGYKCAEPNFPGVYTSVSNFLPWVQRHSRRLST